MTENESGFSPEMEDAPAVILSENEVSRIVHEMDDDDFAAFLKERQYNFNVPRELVTSSGRADRTFTSAKEMREYLIEKKLPPVV